MNAPPHRRALLVGSLPAPDEATAMAGAMSVLGPLLDSLPDGEIGERSDRFPGGVRGAWTAILAETCAMDTDSWEVVEEATRNEAGWATDYGQNSRLKPRRKPSDMANHLDLGWNTFAKQSYPVFEELRSRADRPELRFQVGLPTALGMTFVMLSPINALRYASAFNRRLAWEANDILDHLGGHNVRFQLEVPGELAMAYRMRGRGLALPLRFVLGLVDQVRPEAPFGVHLCFGDLNNKALIRRPELDTAVAFTNELIDRWPATHDLDYVHMPLAEADIEPTTDRSWYEPLADLRLPSDCRLVAGFVHDKLEPDEHDRLLDMIEDIVGGPVDVASSCGLGRRDEATAQQLMAETARLAAVS
ncbi:MAG: hypothetical protein AAF480_05085 [Actinomycetota bacterium]